MRVLFKFNSCYEVGTAIGQPLAQQNGSGKFQFLWQIFSLYLASTDRKGPD